MDAVTNLARNAQAFTSNVYLVEGERTVLVDAGMSFDVVADLRERGADLDAVVLTHTHPDHVGNLDAVVDAFDVDVWGYDPAAVDHALADGDSVQMGDHDYVALHTPGHKDDHLCLYAESAGVLFAGDLVFEGGSFGRTDLEEGDRETLIESIDHVRETVDDRLSVAYSGHGGPITGNAVETLALAARAARR